MELKDLWKHYEDATDQSHGVAHIKGVLTNAQDIAKNYKELHPEDVEAAALLHDIGREAELQGHGKHTELGVELARPYIAHLDDSRQHAVMDAISNHMSTGHPTTTLGRVISDADRLCSVPVLPVRSFHYQLAKGLQQDESLRRGYWTLRHKKLKTLEGRANNFHTPEGKELFRQQVKDLENRTRTFKGYIQSIPGVDANMEFKKHAASITGYHYTKDGKYPDNILNFSEDKQKEVLKAMSANGDNRGRAYIKDREEREEKLYRAAKRKLDTVLTKHPLYFRIGKDNGEWSGKDKDEYKIDKWLLSKSTYTIGDSLNTKSGEGKLFTYDEIKSLTDEAIKEKLEANKGDEGQYIEGQLWYPYKVDGTTIVEDKEMSKQLTTKTANDDSFYEELEADLKGEHEAIGQYQVHIDKAPEGKVKEKLIEIRDEEKHHVEELGALLAKEKGTLPEKKAFITYDDLKNAGHGGMPAGSVTPSLKGQAAMAVTNALVPGGDVGKAAEMVQGKAVDFIRTRNGYGEKLKTLLARRGETELGKVAAEFEGRMVNFRTNYYLPSSDPMDQLKIKGYKDTNERLLKKHKWQPAIQEHLEKEMEYADGKTEQAKAQEEISLKQQGLMLKSQELGLKMQEKGIGQQEALTKAQIKMMEGQAHRSKKEGDALVISAGKGVALPGSGQPAGMPNFGTPTGPNNGEQPNANPNAQQQQADPQQQGQQGQQVQTQTAGDQQTSDVPPPKGKEKRAAFEVAVKNLAARAKNFAKNVGGRTNELNQLHEELGAYRRGAEHFPEGSFHNTVNAEAAKATEAKIKQTTLDVRKARVDATIGGTVGTALYNEYSEPKYASEHTTIQLNRKEGYTADVLHALETFQNGIQTDAKKKLIASAAMASVAAGMAAYGMSRIPSGLSAYTVHDKAGLELGKAVGKMIPFTGTVGGAYYAWRNKDNDKKRILGTAVSALSSAGLATQVLDRTPVPGVTKDMVMKAMPFSVGSTTMFGSIMYGAHPAQHISDEEVVEQAMSSNAPLHEVAETVNMIREKKNLNTRYPVMRYLPVPNMVRKVLNSNYGKPAGTMNGADMAQYFQAQVDAEYRGLLRKYEAQNGRASQAAMTDLKNMAHDTVTSRLVEQ